MAAERSLRILAIGGVLALVPVLAQGQVLTDGDFLQANYTQFDFNLTDVKYNFDYSNFDVFGDGFILGSIPEAPRSGVVGGTATTGVFLSVNANSLDPNSGQAAAAAIYPGVSVGNGTATPTYKVTVDVFHSTGTGVYDPVGDFIGQGGTTNYSLIGTNMATTSLAIDSPATPTASFGTADNQQGQMLASTADGDSGTDYMNLYAAQEYRANGFQSTTNTVEDGDITMTGLASGHINEFWATQGFERFRNAGSDDGDPTNDLLETEHDGFWGAVDPANIGGYDGSDFANTGKVFWDDAGMFPVHNGGNHNTVPDLTIAGFSNQAHVMANDEIVAIGSPSNQTRTIVDGGTPYNEWLTHEIYYDDVGGSWTYVIDGKVIAQMNIDADENNVGTDIISTISRSGDVVLGIWDRFDSINFSPEGSNYIIFDNLVVESVDPNDIPDMTEFLQNAGFLPAAGCVPGSSLLDGDGSQDCQVTGADLISTQQNFGNVGAATQLGDANHDGQVTGADLISVQQNFGNVGAPAAGAVPEPATLALLGLGALALVARKRG